MIEWESGVVTLREHCQSRRQRRAVVHLHCQIEKPGTLADQAMERFAFSCITALRARSSVSAASLAAAAASTRVVCSASTASRKRS